MHADTNNPAGESSPATAPPQGADRGGPGAGRLSVGVIAIGLSLYALWGGNPVAARYALIGLPPVGLAGLRFAIAALGLAAWCAYQRESLWPTRREVSAIVICGVLFTVQIDTFHLAVFWSNSSHAAVLVNTFPIFVAITAHFWLADDRLTPGKIAGIVLGIIGIAAVFADRWGSDGATMLRGDVVCVISAIILGFQATYFKSSTSRISPNRLTFWQMLICAVVDIAYSISAEGLLGARPHGLVLVALLYQGVVVGAFGFTVWGLLVKRVAVSKLTLFALTTPLWGVLLSHLFLREPVTEALIVGTALVALGIGVAVRS